jgi:hypothetical protein
MDTSIRIYSFAMDLGIIVYDEVSFAVMILRVILQWFIIAITEIIYAFIYRVELVKCYLFR